MPAYDKQFFLKRFENAGSDELIERAMTSDLTDEAKQAIHEILGSRGVHGEGLELRASSVAKDMFRRSGVTNHCDFCGKLTLAPLREGEQKFCDRECLRQARLLELSVNLAPDLIAERACAIRIQPCPRCKRVGSIVEMRPTYLITSLFWYCERVTHHELCCRRCGIRDSIAAALYCSLLGWWSGIGLLSTPVRIMKNLYTAWRWHPTPAPSPQLLYRARLDLAESLGSSGVLGNL